MFSQKESPRQTYVRSISLRSLNRLERRGTIKRERERESRRSEHHPQFQIESVPGVIKPDRPANVSPSRVFPDFNLNRWLCSSASLRRVAGFPLLLQLQPADVRGRARIFLSFEARIPSGSFRSANEMERNETRSTAYAIPRRWLTLRVFAKFRKESKKFSYPWRTSSVLLQVEIKNLILCLVVR